MSLGYTCTRSQTKTKQATPVPWIDCASAVLEICPRGRGIHSFVRPLLERTCQGIKEREKERDDAKKKKKEMNREKRPWPRRHASLRGNCAEHKGNLVAVRAKLTRMETRGGSWCVLDRCSIHSFPARLSSAHKSRRHPPPTANDFDSGLDTTTFNFASLIPPLSAVPDCRDDK